MLNKSCVADIEAHRRQRAGDDRRAGGIKTCLCDEIDILRGLYLLIYCVKYNINGYHFAIISGFVFVCLYFSSYGPNYITMVLFRPLEKY